MSSVQIIYDTFEKGAGILRLIPNVVPRRFSDAGRRLRRHPDDYYALGMQRGSIKERWFSSVIVAMNGPLAPPDEGLSYVAPENSLRGKFSLRDVILELGSAIIGPTQTVTVKDGAAYGCILVQGHGKFGAYDAEATIMLRYGQLSADEYFVSEAAAQAGVTITNAGRGSRRLS
jgi:hypothetical protein